MGMSILCSGEGEACGDGEVVPAGICIPGMFSDFAGEGAGVWEGGVCSPLISIPGMACLIGASCTRFFRRTVALPFRFTFCLAFGFDVFMPDMFCMSSPRCCARTAGTPAAIKIAATVSAQILVRDECLPFITSP
ncbi:MAG: hypothetical protein ACJ74T_03555 [Pyrinomonadaceae bacterium]